MKIYLVTIDDGEPSRADNRYLVRAHTRTGAERFVEAKLKPDVTANVPTQDELVAALQSGIAIEDATAPAGSGTPDEAQEQSP